ncbi:(d)CMP kinase [Anaerofustis stercorihominis]|uniref:Cytidylate kinase n=1 Tax=Anaerofustis stercorihominis DSM 17244 TaxID=445971 RepID=B1C7U1_9FIRM|nr:(d)CMP kinase [Anaerofustis stercorihominis]EDS73078.1 cytidylate kinase [Anaerofustis stercorihominis DSM 17244]MCQ4794389.1 (d)CMP kinase [Anaerofustis stercorihominis]
MDNIINIAIDGPAGSGKSTVAKIIAKKLNITYLDTGSMYRAFTYYALNNDIKSNDKEGINDLLNSIDLVLDKENVFVNDKDVTKEIRFENIDKNVSDYAAIKEVREKMVNIQREISKGKSVIMDGRDIGSVVLPNAKFKFYLDASSEERAKRRYLQNIERGKEIPYEDILRDIELRDELDKTREVDPLVICEDAVVVDTSDMNIDDVVEFIINKVSR